MSANAAAKKRMGPIMIARIEKRVYRFPMRVSLCHHPPDLASTEWQLTSSSVTWTVGNSDLHSRWSFGGELRPGIIHKLSPILTASVDTDLELDPRVWVVGQFWERSSNNIDRFL